MTKHPGDVLREQLEAKNITLTEAAVKTGVATSTLSRLVRRKHSLTAELAVKISILCNCDPLTLLTYQNVYDLAQLEGKDNH